MNFTTYHIHWVSYIISLWEDFLLWGNLLFLSHFSSSVLYENGLKKNPTHNDGSGSLTFYSLSLTRSAGKRPLWFIPHSTLSRTVQKASHVYHHSKSLGINEGKQFYILPPFFFSIMACLTCVPWSQTTWNWIFLLSFNTFYGH